MMKINQIREPVKQELNDFNAFFKDSVKSKVALLDIITNYIIRTRGKQMRPLFVLLTAKMFGEVNDSSYTAATLIELLHTTTLVHDDVVDESYERRGVFSIKALWKSKVAVLVGDYLLSKGLLIALEKKAYDTLEIVSEAVKEIMEGELYQIQKSKKLDIKEEEYFDIIRKKTATLIAACTKLGPSSVGADASTLEKMKVFGEYTGIAFQIRDDLFDYQKNGLVGKPMGIDLKEKKLTLPLIYALKQADSRQKRKILKIISSGNLSYQKLKEIIRFVEESGGMEYTIARMNEYRDEAINIISGFPDSDARTALIGLVDYSINRKK
jgi:octaprenyl-diphosphate synthase